MLLQVGAATYGVRHQFGHPGTCPSVEHHAWGQVPRMEGTGPGDVDGAAAVAKRRVGEVQVAFRAGWCQGPACPDAPCSVKIRQFLKVTF